MEVIIVGCGLSGLTCALRLSEIAEAEGLQLNINMFDSRDRVGGRILTTEQGIDLGAAWHWKINDNALLNIAKAVNVKTEEQLCAGRALSQARVLFSKSGASKVTAIGNNMSPCGDGGARFQNGAGSLTQELACYLQRLPNVKMNLSTKVKHIRTDSQEGRVIVDIQDTLDSGSTTIQIIANAVIIAAPPQLVCKTISFTPSLGAEKERAMLGCDTWMGQTGKVCFVYKDRFWFDSKQLSGTVFSQTGPLTQIWDNSRSREGGGENNPQSVAALCGFVFDEAVDNLESEQRVRETILPQLVQIFGEEAADPLAIHFKSWKADCNTNITEVDEDIINLPRVAFGHPLLRQPAVNGRVLFAGTETCPGEHGHMNGAVLSGERCAKEVMTLLQKT